MWIWDWKGAGYYHVASGAGKSTVLNLLGGMDTNDEGKSGLMVLILRIIVPTAHQLP